MRSVEVKSINLKSAMKAVLFASVIPFVLLLVFVGLQIVVMNSMLSPGASDNSGTAAALSSSGVTVSATSGFTQLLVFLLPLTIYPVAIGLGVLVLVFSYNLFASRLGGLKIMISENSDIGT